MRPSVNRSATALGTAVSFLVAACADHQLTDPDPLLRRSGGRINAAAVLEPITYAKCSMSTLDPAVRGRFRYEERGLALAVRGAESGPRIRYRMAVLSGRGDTVATATCVVPGDAEAIAELERRLTRREVKRERLVALHAMLRRTRGTAPSGVFGSADACTAGAQCLATTTVVASSYPVSYNWGGWSDWLGSIGSNDQSVRDNGGGWSYSGPEPEPWEYCDPLDPKCPQKLEASDLAKVDSALRRARPDSEFRDRNAAAACATALLELQGLLEAGKVYRGNPEIPDGRKNHSGASIEIKAGEWVVHVDDEIFRAIETDSLNHDFRVSRLLGVLLHEAMHTKGLSHAEGVPAGSYTEAPWYYLTGGFINGARAEECAR